MEIDEIKLKNIIREAIQETLNEIELNEILSVAEPVDGEADRLLNLIDDNYKEYGKEKNIADGVKKYTGTLHDYVFGVETDISFTVVVANSLGIYGRYSREINKPLAYNTKTNTLYLSYVVISGQIDYRQVADDFGHELKHMFEELQKRQQPIQRTFERPNGNDLYDFATSQLNDKDLYSRIIAKLVYYSSRREQDAYLNGLYGELKKIGQPSAYAYDQTKFSMLNNDYADCLRTFRMSSKRPGFLAATKEYTDRFGMTYNHLLNFFGSRYNRMEKKKDRVLKRYDMWYSHENKVIWTKPSAPFDDAIKY